VVVVVVVVVWRSVSVAERRERETMAAAAAFNPMEVPQQFRKWKELELWSYGLRAPGPRTSVAAA
jgi:hypothetical protein